MSVAMRIEHIGSATIQPW